MLACSSHAVIVARVGPATRRSAAFSVMPYLVGFLRIVGPGVVIAAYVSVVRSGLKVGRP